MELEKDLFIKNSGHKKTSEEEAEKLYFIPKSEHEQIYSLAKEKFEHPFEFLDILEKLNGFETIDFLMGILKHANSPKKVDCSKALVFVLGNLDEAYKMSQNFTPDISANDFHEESLKITIPHIKDALKARFRSEQIARLGNTHIIYPAFNEKSFREIIDLELNKISEAYSHKIGFNMEFDKSIKDLIYNEGVYPTQGTRPLFTSIHQIINTKVGHIVSEYFTKKLQANKIRFSYKDEHVLIEYKYGERVVHSLSISQVLNLGKLRKNKRDDLQAITAVHEAGHAIIAITLLKIMPEAVYSITTDSANSGFVYTKFRWNYISKKELLDRIALYLGGIVAEKIVFGKDRVTAGSASDIHEATSFITTMLKEHGLGDFLGSYHERSMQTRECLYDDTNEITKSAEKWLKLGAELAEETLVKQEVLLLKMAGYLSDNRHLNKDMLKDFVKKYAVDFNASEIIENGDRLFYRNVLKEKLNSVGIKKTNIKLGGYEFSLNKETNE